MDVSEGDADVKRGSMGGTGENIFFLQGAYDEESNDPSSRYILPIIPERAPESKFKVRAAFNNGRRTPMKEAEESVAIDFNRRMRERMREK